MNRVSAVLYFQQGTIVHSVATVLYKLTIVSTVNILLDLRDDSSLILILDQGFYFYKESIFSISALLLLTCLLTTMDISDSEVSFVLFYIWLCVDFTIHQDLHSHNHFIAPWKFRGVKNSKTTPIHTNGRFFSWV